MISIKRMHAGDGYGYLLRSVVDGEGVRLNAAASPMTRYYTEAGTPPGLWMGSGLAGLATGDGVAAGAPVTSEQMERLFKHGVDPVTGERLARRSYEVPKTWQERVDRRISHLPATLTGEARREQGHAIRDEERGRQVRRSVAGFDLTFSPPKSVSALWAVAGTELRDKIAAAHHAAIADTLRLVERDVARTRVGTDGVAQVGTRGVVATAFDHYDSRAGDPQLHTHVVIANRVQGEDGLWRTLDSHGALFPAVVALSETYDTLLADQLTRRTGIGWERRGTPRKAKNQRWELAGVPDDLITAFSRRADGIEVEKDRLSAAWTAEHGNAPDDRTIIRLRQQATLSTRPGKDLHSLAELTADWTDRAGDALGQDPTAWAERLARSARQGPTGTLGAADVSTEQIDQLAGHVLDRLAGERGTWRRWNVHAEAARITMTYRMDSPHDRDQLLTTVVDRTLARSVQLSSPIATHTPAGFRTADGSSAFTPTSTVVYTAPVVLDAEARLLTAACTRTGPRCTATASGTAPRVAGDGAWALTGDQVDAVRQIAGSGLLLDVLVGPAGTGKTTTLGTLRLAWEAEHGAGSVVGLAPSAVAADVLGDSLGIPTENTAKWLTEHQHGTAARLLDAARQHRQAADGARLSGRAARHTEHLRRAQELTTEVDRWRFRSGQLVIVDEASLAGTLTLDGLTAAATTAGAKLLLVGDWAQLSAVEAGGAFGMLVRDRDDVPELAAVHRFTNEWERGASTRLRSGDASVVAEYTGHGRVHGGDHDAMIDTAYTAWSTDTTTGHSSVLIAGDNHTVKLLNERARADRVSWGQVEPTGTALHDGTLGGAGDRVVTRHNDRQLTTGRGWVKNGDQWDVLARHADGSLDVRRAPGQARVRLPAAYVAHHVELCYATTAHRSQGMTVDTAHAVVTGAAMTREVLYVALTRGRHSNRAYVCTDSADTGHDAWPEDDQPQTADRVLATVLRNSGAEQSAHETIRTEQERQHSVRPLAAEYETIARQAHVARWRAVVAAADLPPELARAVFTTAAGGPLVAALRRADAYGLDPARTLAAATRNNSLPTGDTDAGLSRLTADLHGAASRVPSRTSAASRRFIAGLIPPADPVGDPDVDQALADRAELIEARASELVARAGGADAAWLGSLGAPPSDPLRAAAWNRCAVTVAAYRDRHDVTDPATPLGADQPSTWT